MAVPADAPCIDISTGQALRRSVQEVERIAVSTGPSGVALFELFARWGFAETVRDRLVQTPPSVPVGEAIVARHEATLDFQQMSELMGFGGIALLGPLPPAVQGSTTFQAALIRGWAQPDAVLALLAYPRFRRVRRSQSAPRHGGSLKSVIQELQNARLDDVFSRRARRVHATRASHRRFHPLVDHPAGGALEQITIVI